MATVTRTLAAIRFATEFVLPNEPAWGIYEGPAKLNGNDGSETWRWVQDVTVIRDDQKAHYIVDLGDYEDFRYVTPLYMYSGGADTVAQLQAFADKNREDFYWQRRAEEMIEESTLIPDIIQQAEMIHEAIHNRSTLGPYQTTQRNGYSHVTTQRQFKERVRERTGKVILHG